MVAATTAKAFFPLAVLLATVTTSTLSQGRAPALSTREIESALRWARDGEPSPYLVHHAQGPDGSNRIVVGAVYTPSIRVALAARLYLNQGKELTAAEVPSSLVLPEAWVAVRWYTEHCQLAATWPNVEIVPRNAFPGGLRGRYLTCRHLSTRRNTSGCGSGRV